MKGDKTMVKVRNRYTLSGKSFTLDNIPKHTPKTELIDLLSQVNSRFVSSNDNCIKNKKMAEIK